MNLQLIPLLGKIFLTFIFTVSFSKAKDKDSVRVVSYNVWYGFTKKKERKKEWTEYVKSLDCDIVALQELNEYTPEKLAKDAQSWGHSYSALLKESGFPTGITSRFPLENLKKEIVGYHHGMLSCEVGGIQIYVIHFHPGHWEIRHREVDLLLNTLKVHNLDTPVLLVGDFNTFSHRDESYYNRTADLIPFFRRLDLRWKSNRNLRDDRLDYSHLRKFEEAGYKDLIAERRKRFLGTFPTKLRPEEDNGPSRRLDYFFANKVLSEKCTKAEYLVNMQTDVLSDHYPAVAEFELPE
jgi:exodeoxyribonuclease III